MNTLVGTVITNAAGEKAISFTDEAWAALPLGAEIYADLPPVYCECPVVGRCITQGGHFPACMGCHRRLKP